MLGIITRKPFVGKQIVQPCRIDPLARLCERLNLFELTANAVEQHRPLHQFGQVMDASDRVERAAGLDLVAQLGGEETFNLFFGEGQKSDSVV